MLWKLPHWHGSQEMLHCLRWYVRDGWSAGRGGVQSWRAGELLRVTVLEPGGCLSPASCRSPFSHSWPSAGRLLPLWLPRWPAPSCHWSLSCRQTCGQDDQEEEQEDWGQGSKDQEVKMKPQNKEGIHIAWVSETKISSVKHNNECKKMFWVFFSRNFLEYSDQYSQNCIRSYFKSADCEYMCNPFPP